MRIMKSTLFGLLAAIATFSSANSSHDSKEHKLKVHISVADGLLKNSTDGRIILIVAPDGVDPLNDTPIYFDVPHNKLFGLNVFDYGPKSTVTFTGGGEEDTEFGVFGWPNASLDVVPKGKYGLQAFLTKYENANRSDGSQVSVHFPCGDGAAMPNTIGGLATAVTNVTILDEQQQFSLTFTEVVGFEANKTQNFTEIVCYSQGYYEDVDLLKHVKIRSTLLSEFWGRDMYVAANILIPYGYNESDKDKRYPVIYSQDHYPAQTGFFGYPENKKWKRRWDNGTLPGPHGADIAMPEVIVVKFRHETPFYDDSYAVNSANLGPYGDALNDELIPHIDAKFHTIAKPYGRLLEGGSTGGWESLANMIYRPDLFGATFTSYPDPLDFTRFQTVDIYNDESAFFSANGTANGIARKFVNGSQVDITDFENMNHYELVFGTKTRSLQQMDIFNAVFGVQGLNGYPLEAYNKITGEIYPKAAELWKYMDLTEYVTSNWDKLGEVLRGRIYIYVGTWDDYYLNEAVYEFKRKVEEKGGPNWANFTILEHGIHGTVYQNRTAWEFLPILDTWFKDHAPDGKTPLLDNVTVASARGNIWKEVIERGGHQAALARQAPPVIEKLGGSKAIVTSVGRWDPGVRLEAQWFVEGHPDGDVIKVKEGDELVHETASPGKPPCKLLLKVTGRKRGYLDETRESNTIDMRS